MMVNTVTQKKVRVQRANRRDVAAIMVLAIPVWALATGCSDDTVGPPPPSTQIYAIGDSIMAFHRSDGKSIPQVAGIALQKNVHNAAVGGAYFTDDSGSGDTGADIRRQYTDGPWEWVILDGGGNDFNEECGCGACDDTMDDIISSDGQSGAMPTFVRDLVDQGINVVVMGYYELPESAQFGFDKCRATILPEFKRRQALMADGSERIIFVDGSTVVQPDNLDAYVDDHVHPSVAGSELLGNAIADAIRKFTDKRHNH